jgi:fumarate reductase (CoM/CoB) subunit A
MADPDLVDEIVETDVLVVGGGGAGARAAIEADEHGADVVLASKGEFGRSGITHMIGVSHFGAALGHADPRDSPEHHFLDIIAAGRGMCDERLARIIAFESPQRLLDLERFGAEFKKAPDGKFIQIFADNATYPRVCTAPLAIETGRQIMAALANEVRSRDIRVMEGLMATSLLTSDGAVVGATGLDLENLDFKVLKAKSTILATGGLGQVYAKNYNPLDATGDGRAMAYRAGAELVNMEFIGMGPCIAYPIRAFFYPFRLRPVMYNGKGEEFLEKYIPEGVDIGECFRAKDAQLRKGSWWFDSESAGKYIDIAIHKEVVEGRGTERMAVYFDLAHCSDGELEDAGLLKLMRGFDFHRDRFEVQLVAQHANGGIWINERAETSIPGLFAAGEDSCVHGAGRPGGNSLANCQVFGARAGKYAALRASGASAPRIDWGQVEREYDRTFKPHERKEGVDVVALRREVQNLMWRNCFAIRDGGGLSAAIRRLEEIRREAIPQLHAPEEEGVAEALVVQNIVDVGIMIAKAALIREESRGMHYRGDFPTRDDRRWLRRIYIRRVDGETVAEARPAYSF